MTRPMRGMDGGFFQLEGEGVHMHTLKSLVFASGPAPSPEAMEGFCERALDVLPDLRTRFVELPGGLAQPLEVLTSVNFTDHMERVHLTAPGSTRQLNDVISQVASTPLPRDRPLWRLTVVEGLRGGRWAVVVSIHHAIADGTAFVGALQRLQDFERGEDLVFEPTPPTGVPALLPRLGLGLRALAGQLLSWPGILWSLFQGWRAVRARRRDGPLAAARVFNTRPMSFNRGIDSSRVFATARLSLERIKTIRRRTGATVNDVVLTLVTGALRAYLRGRGERANRPLVASVPTRLAEAGNYFSRNHVSTLFASLPVHIDEPGLALAETRRGMLAAKEDRELRGLDSNALIAAVPPFVLRGVIKLMRSLRLWESTRPPINLIVSNVRGPEAIELAGQRVEAIYSVGPLLSSIGLNVTVWSYEGELYFSLLASRRQNPDLHRLAAQLEPALDELEASVGIVDGPTGLPLRMRKLQRSGSWAVPRPATRRPLAG